MKRFEYQAFLVVWAEDRETADKAKESLTPMEGDGWYVSIDDAEPIEEDDDE